MVLTDAGRSLGQYLQQVCSTCAATTGDSACLCGDSVENVSQLCVLNDEFIPHWDGRKYDLWAGPNLVKRFRRRAPNQMRVLDAFERNGWPEMIDDPLPEDRYDVDPKQRLHNTIKDLNRSLRETVIHFCGDGTGTGVIWERVCW